jgi:hypothetical protein
MAVNILAEVKDKKGNTTYYGAGKASEIKKQPEEQPEEQLEPSKQGNNVNERGTQNTRSPTEPTKPIGSTKSSIGMEDKFGSKGPLDRMKDNVSTNVARKVKGKFNSSGNPNEVNNISGLHQQYKSPYQQQAVNNMLSSSGLGGNFFGNMVNRLKNVFNDNSEHIGNNINIEKLFQDMSKYKKSKPTEVMQEEIDSANNNYKFITSEKNKKVKK